MSCSVFSKATTAVLLCSLQLSSSHLLLECSFKAAQVPVSSDNVTLLVRGDQYVRRDLTL